MRVALYLRRSTEEHQQASLDVQRSEAIRFAEGRGWSVDLEQVFVDDGVSRAEFIKRPGLNRLLRAAREGRFDVLIARDESRLGGDMLRTTLLMQDLVEAGVRLVYYATGEEVTLDDPTQKMVIAIRNYAAEMERSRSASRTREHLETKARRGLNVGGRVYGYDNVEVCVDDRRVHVEYKINEREAAIVVRIFTLKSQRISVRTIAKTLNGEGVPPPRAGQRGTGSWSSTCIWEMLRRERYRGVLVWGRRGSVYRGGTRVTVDRDASTCTRVERPDLRIVSEALWAAVQASGDEARRFSGKAGAAGPAPRYLLTGLARCAQCGGPINASTGKAGKETIKVYGCAYYRTRGTCTNKHVRPVETVDEAVVDWIRQNVLSHDVVEQIVADFECSFTPPATTDAADETIALEAELRGLQTEIDRLVSALLATDEKPDALVRRLAEREVKVAALQTRIAGLRAPRLRTPTHSKASLAEEARRRLASLRDLLTANLAEGRRALQTILEGPLKFTPVGVQRGTRRYQIDGAVSLRPLFLTVSDPNGLLTF